MGDLVWLHDVDDVTMIQHMLHLVATDFVKDGSGVKYYDM